MNGRCARRRFLRLIVVAGAWCLSWTGAAGAADPARAGPLVGTVTATHDDGTLTIDLGTRHGVGAGTAFKIFAPSLLVRIPLTETVTYREGAAIARAEVVEADVESSQAKLTYVEAGTQVEVGLDAVVLGSRRPAGQDRAGEAAAAGPAQLALDASLMQGPVGQTVTLAARVEGGTGGGPPAVFHWSATGGPIRTRASTHNRNEWTFPLAAGTYQITCRRVPVGGGDRLEAHIQLQSLGRQGMLEPKALRLERAVGRTIYDGDVLRVWAVAFAPDGTALIADGRTRKLWTLSPTGGISRVPTEGAGALRQPVAVAASAGRYFVLDRALRTVKVFQADSGQLVTTFDASARLDDAVDLVVAPNGMSYVLDRGRRNVAVFDRNGTFRLAFGRKGKGRGQFLAPVALTVDRQGILWVLDAKRRDLQGFDPYLGEAGNVKLPDELDGQVADVAFAPDGKSFYLLTTDPAGITRFDRSGVPLISSATREGVFAGLPRAAERLEVDPQGRVVVSGRSLRHVLRFGPSGEPRGRYGGEDLGRAMDIAVSPAGRQFLLDESSPHVLRFGADGWFQGRGLASGGSGRTEVRMPGRLVAVVRSVGKATGPSPATRQAPAGGPNPAGTHVVLFALEYGGTLLYELDMAAGVRRTFGGKGSVPGQFRAPADLAVGPGGLLAVLDRGLYRVSLFEPGSAAPTLRPLSRGKRAHEVVAPWRMAMDPSGGEMYIYDRKRFAINKYSFDLGYRGSFGSRGHGDGQFVDVVRLAVDEAGWLWVADRGRRDLQLLDMRRTPLRHVRTFKLSELDGPIVGMALDATGRVHVLTRRESVYVYRTEF